jgi:hypothetical protein
MIPTEATEEHMAERQEGVDDENSKPAMTAAQAETKIAEDIGEFWNNRSIEEARHYFTALGPKYRHLLPLKKRRMM